MVRYCLPQFFLTLIYITFWLLRFFFVPRQPFSFIYYVCLNYLFFFYTPNWTLISKLHCLFFLAQSFYLTISFRVYLSSPSYALPPPPPPLLSVEDQKGLKTEKSNCLPVYNSHRHSLQAGCLSPHAVGAEQGWRHHKWRGKTVCVSRRLCIRVGGIWLQAGSDSEPWINLRPRISPQLQFTNTRAHRYPRLNLNTHEQVSEPQGFLLF